MTLGLKAFLRGITHHSGHHADLPLVENSSFRAVPSHFDRPAPDPVLPMDLERYIFELAGWNDAKACSSLLLVAKRVYSWIFVLQHNILLFDAKNPIPKMQHIITTRSREFLKANVKAVVFRVTTQADVVRFLNICKDVVHLALISDGSSFHMNSLGMYILDLRPRSVSMHLVQAFDFSSSDLRIPFFSQLTHLHLTDWPNEWSKLKLDNPQLFPELTHLAFTHWSHNPDHLALFDRILTKRLPLQELVLVVIWDGFKRPFGFSDKLMEDVRLVFMPIKDYVQDWHDFVAGGTQNMWSYAEQITWVRKEKRLLASQIKPRR
ncbi:hypothetical protein BDN72DRAFT_893039 [Pluteus cervinus]|uniref:Uncharacterized protein n=1 Tax=Pluteus cervinus TaxID=181527 RepID=A0ACD3BAV2_9AGAR|nr:hypothetical protein BDN72DRAFT_893039 [Pluteus cervinus]